MICQKIYKHTNFNKIRTEVENIIQTSDFSNGQLMCQTLEEGSTDWHTGIGNLKNIVEKKEHSYKFINPILQGTEIEKLILKHNGYRTRILALKPGQCYSIHNDLSMRIHLPIITNDHCWMIWPKHSECHQLKEGNVYLTNTKEYHTFFNGSKNHTRIHLLMCIYD